VYALTGKTMQEAYNMDLTETTIASRDIFEGRIIKVRVDTVKLPDGGSSTREVVEHSGAVGVVAIDADDHIILVRQFRKPIDKIMLEIPAGTLFPEEEPLFCAQRELREETGFRADRWEKILSYYSTPGFCNEHLHLFLAHDLTAGDCETDEDEFVEAIRIPLAEAYQLIYEGEIADGKSIIGIQYAVAQKLAGTLK
jgi:ADP-ribose pyrophosphatase